MKNNVNLKKTIFFGILLFFVCNLVYPYELNGVVSSNGDGTYAVELENQYGHVYSGSAEDNGDDTLNVQVYDYSGTSYSGTATSNGGGTYTLDLYSDSSGGSANGTVTLDD